MVMKSKLWKMAVLEIQSRKKIFLSLLLMSLLGVGFFAGIKATSPSMKKTLDSYYRDLSFYDIEIVSKEKLTESDLEFLSSISEVKKVESSFAVDRMAHYQDKISAAKMYRMEDEMNQLRLVEGRFPKSYDECVIDSRIKKLNETFQLGDTIEIEDYDTLKESRMKVVGIVDSPIYVSSIRGNTNLSTGTIDYFLSVPKENFVSSDLVTSYFLALDNPSFIDSDSYRKEVEKVTKKIKKQYPSWQLSTRLDNVSYQNFILDTERIDRIAEVFPIIFFVVATLISLTSMTRMVEEQRIEIGTLKSLGYTKNQISIKYLLYASIATVVGGFLGILIGVNIIPRIIYLLYQMMYTTKDLLVGYHFSFSLFGLLIAYICIIGATMFAVWKELKNSPAILMRPKSPKSGKRVWLEKISFLWNHLNFTSKVTVRNLFRYKKRFFMTILGIGGCTSLIFAGFALRESVSSLLPSQYENVFLYDMQAITMKNLTSDDLSFLEANENIKEAQVIGLEAVTVEKGKDFYDNVQLLTIPRENSIENFIQLVDYQTQEKLSIQNGAIITEKLAELLDIEVGDSISVQNYRKETVEIPIQGITENYLYHYLYLSDEAYLNLFGHDVIKNALLINSPLEEEEDLKKVAEEILTNQNFAKVIVTETAANMMNDTMENLNYVVWVLIVSAGILAVCVLYNLASVNISERIRELATIKVLGFYDQEVHSYVEKETFLLTIIGMTLGLGMGYFLSIVIIKTCELDMMKFPIHFSWSCSLLSILITSIFAFLVSILTYFHLKKINMIESLKSVE